MKIPKGWKPLSIGDVADFAGGSQPPRSTFEYQPSDQNIRLIQIRDYKSEKHATFIPKELARKFCDESDVMIGRYGPPVFQILRGIAGAYNVALMKTIPTAEVTREYLFYYFQLRELFLLIDHLSQRSSGQTGVDLDALRRFPFPCPPRMERAKIITIIDCAIDSLRVLDERIAATELRKQGLAQRLLSGDLRFDEFKNEPWEEVRLGDVFSRILDKVADDPDPPMVMSITAKTGFVSQADKFSRVIAGDSLGKYVCLKRGDFSYNKGNSKTYPMGAIFRLHEFDRGCVPNVFFSFRSASKRVVPEFYEHYFAAGKLNRQLRRLINSGVRNDGLLNLKAEEFFDVMIDLPSPDEQRKVAACLSSAGNEIELLRQQRAALDELKRGLMQQLLTGKVRVKVPKEKA